MPSWDRFPGRSTFFFFALALVLFVIEHINGRFWMNDFRVYYGAATALLNGEPLYGVAHGLDSGVFKYAPVMAVLFVPFALLPYTLAASVHYFLIVGAFIGALHLADRMIREHLFAERAPRYAPLFLAGLVVIVHLHRELHLGNINVILLAVLLLGLHQLLRGGYRVAGLLIGLAILAKPHFMVLFPLLLLYRQWTTTAVMAMVLVAGLLAPALFVGPTANMALHGAWMDQVAAHNASLIYVGGDDRGSVNTVYSFLHRSVLQHFVDSPARWEVPVILMLIASGVGLFVLRNIRRRVGAPQGMAFAYLMLLALVPCLTLTDTEHFIFALPMIGYIVLRMVPVASPRWLPYIAVPILLAIGGNWEDALGALSDTLAHYGVLGIGTMALIVLNVVLFLRSTGSDEMDRHVSQRPKP